MEVGAHQSPTDGPDGIYDFSGQTTNEVVQTLTSTHRLPSAILLLVTVGKADFAAVRNGLGDEALLHDKHSCVRQQAAGLLGPSVLRDKKTADATMMPQTRGPLPAVCKEAS